MRAFGIFLFVLAFLPTACSHPDDRRFLYCTNWTKLQVEVPPHEAAALGNRLTTNRCCEQAEQYLSEQKDKRRRPSPQAEHVTENCTKLGWSPNRPDR